MPNEIVYEGKRVCQVDDTLGVGEDCKWPSPNITWGIQSTLPGFLEDDFRRHCELAWSYWSTVCGVRPRYVTTGAPNVVIDLQTGSPGGVLADMQLPCGVAMSASLRMRIDTAEKWIVSENAVPGRIDLIRVLAHELGHAIGLPHFAGANLMAPTYTWAIRKPREYDIAMARSRYGNPVPQPEPPAPEPPSGGYEEILAYLRKGNIMYVRAGGIISKLPRAE